MVSHSGVMACFRPIGLSAVFFPRRELVVEDGVALSSRSVSSASSRALWMMILQPLGSG